MVERLGPLKETLLGKVACYTDKIWYVFTLEQDKKRGQKDLTRDRLKRQSTGVSCFLELVSNFVTLVYPHDLYDALLLGRTSHVAEQESAYFEVYP